MTLPAIEPVHYFRNETGAIVCSDADAPYAAELTDDLARVTVRHTGRASPTRRVAASHLRTALVPR